MGDPDIRLDCGPSAPLSPPLVTFVRKRRCASKRTCTLFAIWTAYWYGRESLTLRARNAPNAMQGLVPLIDPINATMAFFSKHRYKRRDRPQTLK